MYFCDNASFSPDYCRTAGGITAQINAGISFFGAKYPNGLDCSGFVSWVFLNAGLDIGDIGSGVTEGADDISDIGVMHELTYEYANNGDYKVGDIIARDGHTALIAGKDDEYIYIAESLLKGAVMEKFSYKDRNSKLYKFL